ncbi:MAG: C-terminal binding protein [Chloroflexota bacterium]
MSKFKVLVTDYAWPSLALEERILRQAGAELIVAESGDEEELVQLAGGVDAILTCWKSVTAAVIEAATKCQIISRYGVGLDNIDLSYATEMGILVTNVPDFCQEEVSDHAMALMLACARRIIPFSRATSRGEWNPKAHPQIPRLRGQTVGLVGCGHIGKALIPKALGFEMKVCAYTPRITETALAPFGKTTRQLSFLLRHADYLSIHAPLTEETRGLIGEKELREMKPSAFLINTSRGDIVDEDALLKALEEGWIAGAALDVLWDEPPPPDHPLLQMDNVIITPHAAFYSETAIEELAERAAIHVVQVLTGEEPNHLVNPEVFERSNRRFQPFR